MKITFDNSAISEKLTNFPMPVVFDGGESDFWNSVSSDGSDIRFVDSDDSTELYFELEQWDYSGNNMVAWVKVPQVNGGSIADHIFVYYKNDMAVSFDGYYNSAQVWDSNYKMVQHLNETSGHHLDSTANNWDSTTETLTQQGAQIGKVDGADEFDGSSDVVLIGDLDLTGNFTIEFWIKGDTFTDWEQTVTKEYDYAIQIKDGVLGPDIHDGSWDYTKGPYTSLNTATWYHIVWVWDETNDDSYLYVDGSLNSSDTGSYSSHQTNDDNLKFAKWSDSTPEVFDGILDEIRISDTARSAEWIEACYQYQVDQSKIQLEREPKPTLRMSPDSVTCRKYCENFTVQINVTDTVNVEDFEFEIYYNTTLLDYLNVTWNAWGSGTIDNSTHGILIGNTSGSPATGNLTLATITFHAACHHTWRVDDCKNWTNNLNGTIYFQWANLSYLDIPDLRYEKDGPKEINVDPEEVAYIFIPIKGDVDNDGNVDILDLRIAAYYYGVESSDPEWAEASAYDLNCDGEIDILDLVTICGNFGYKYDC